MMSVFSRAGAGIQNILSEWRQPAQNPLSHRLRDDSSPEGRAFDVTVSFFIPTRTFPLCKKLPLSGELAANAMSRLRGFYFRRMTSVLLFR